MSWDIENQPDEALDRLLESAEWPASDGAAVARLERRWTQLTNEAIMQTTHAAPPIPARPVQPVVAPRLAPARPVPPGPGAGTVDDEQEQPSRLPHWLQSAPPWLVSTVVHVVLLIILALWYTLYQGNTNLVAINAEWHEDKGQQLEDKQFEVEVQEPQPAEAPVLVEQPPVVDPRAAPPEIPVTAVEAFTATSQRVSTSIGMLLMGREDGMRQALLGKYGGNGESELAVKFALEWLARVQDPHTGGWSLKGQYADGGQYENTSSATAMALLAFQGAGHTHQRGEFKKVVATGWEYLLKQQAADGNFFSDGPARQELYTHGQCTIAVCELYGMTQDPRFRQPAEKAVEFCVQSQHRLGGWRYAPGSDSDTSVTGWLVMGLQSARMAGLQVPKQTLDNVGRYLDKAGRQNGARYGYQAGSSETEVMTAEGLLCRQYLGWKQNDARLSAGCDWLLASHLPHWNADDRNVYYWYYATQVMHHMEGARWQRWNDVMRDMLVDHQVRSGREKGSWDPAGGTPDRWGIEAGRLFTTCLSTYILEVYYRHLPIYARLNP